MHVEISGPTGAGKSQFTERLLCDLSKHAEILTNHEGHFNFSTLSNASLQNLKLDVMAFGALSREGLLSSEAAFASGLLDAYAVAPITKLNLVRSYLRKVGMFQYLRKKRGAALVIMDEGLIHGAHNLLVHVDLPPRDIDIDAYLNHIPLPDLIVLVRTPLSVVLERTLARLDKPRRLHSAGELRAFAEHAHMLFERVAVHERVAARAIMLNNSESGQTDKVVEAINARLSLEPQKTR